MRLPNALLPFALLAPLLAAQAPTAGALPALLTRVRAIRDATDFRASGRLVSVPASGQRKSYQLSMRARSFAGVLKLFCEITDPAPARVRLLLESRPAGASAVRLGHAGDPAPRELPFERWAESILATDFNYEDLMESQFLWRNQSLLDETTYGARACSVLRSTPGPADRTHYSSVTTWLDQTTDYRVGGEDGQALRQGQGIHLLRSAAIERSVVRQPDRVPLQRPTRIVPADRLPRLGKSEPGRACIRSRLAHPAMTMRTSLDTPARIGPDCWSDLHRGSDLR